MRRTVRLTESDLGRIVKRVINEQDSSYLLTEFPPNVKKFIEQYKLNPQSFIKPIPPATSINFKKNNGQYIGLGNMDFFSKNVDIYMNSSGVVSLFNQMIQNK